MASIPGNESTRDADVPHNPQHSALLYLFQEVSKLSSPANDTLSGTNPWLSEATQSAAASKADDVDTNSPKVSMKMCQHGLPHVDGNSPWKVLSLINLQCERLLHHTDAGESDLTFNSSRAKLSHSVHRIPNVMTNGSDPDAAGVCISVECTLRPSLIGREEELNRPRFSSADCRADAGRLNVSQAAAQLDVCRSVLVEKSVTAASSTCCTEQTIAQVPNSSVAQTARLPHLSPRAWKIFNSNADTGIVLPVGTLASDDNANIVLITAPSTEAQPSVQWSSLLIDSTDVSSSPPGPSGNVAASSLEDSGGSLTSASHDGENETPLVSRAEPADVQAEGDLNPAPKPQRTKTPRKQAHPSRSADVQDPDFQGVMFRIDTELDNSREQCRLMITSKYR